VVTWDVDSRNAAQCARVRRFVFGYAMRKAGRSYAYPGFLQREGVRYLGQSVLFVTASRLAELRRFLGELSVSHHATPAALGADRARAGILPR